MIYGFIVIKEKKKRKPLFFLALRTGRASRIVGKLVVERTRIEVVLHLIHKANIVDPVKDDTRPAHLLVCGLVATELALVGTGEGPAHDDGGDFADDFMADKGEVGESIEEGEAEEVLELQDTIGLAERALVDTVVTEHLIDDLEVLVVEQIVHLNDKRIPEFSAFSSHCISVYKFK